MRISSNLLNDTLTLISLAREVSLAQGQQARAEKFGEVEKGIRKVAPGAQPKEKQEPAGILAQDDFKTLMGAAAQSQSVPRSTERNQLIMAMSAGGMTAPSIAKHVGMTVNEVRMVIAVNNQSSSNMEIGS